MNDIFIVSLEDSNQICLIDVDRLNLISNYKWRFDHTDGYIKHWTVYGKNKKTIYLHVLIFNQEYQNCFIDHKNRCRFDNRFSNLRLVTYAQNAMNQSKQDNCSSNHKGVCWSIRNKKWLVRINANHKSHYGGYFTSEIEAAKKANELMLKHHGEFAVLNII